MCDEGVGPRRGPRRRVKHENEVAIPGHECEGLCVARIVQVEDPCVLAEAALHVELCVELEVCPGGHGHDHRGATLLHHNHVKALDNGPPRLQEGRPLREVIAFMRGRHDDDVEEVLQRPVLEAQPAMRVLLQLVLRG